MSYPKTYRAWRRSITPYPLNVIQSTETLPDKLGADDVLIKIHAVSLNYRDHAILQEGGYPIPVEVGGVSGSDCAAEVVAIGSSVTKFAIGNHVAPTVDLLSLTGNERDENYVALGGNGPGTLREYAVFEEKVLVKLPTYLSWEEASTLPGVGTTVWNVLDQLRKPTEDTAALVQGTGGVSIMALLVCLAAGIKPIITSSSDAKIAKLKQLSPAVQGINYKTEDVKAQVLRLTSSKGVDFVLNNAGISSLPDDLAMIRKNGSIALVGFLDGFTAQFPPEVLLTVLLKACKIQGILAGSRVDLEEINAFLEEKKVDLAPIIDKVFSFEETPDAIQYLASGKHVGKIIVKVS
ncbi:NAD(P)-binding protein [Setomelanomma holmii]|uniref:NAD(P)-binding protein n=1 Tax=Setomelanomma holmii TaxID=210430 RepID=A0A9P4H4D6_9PLEO|nr:NAD(P)-binding protein [Setomelanomma holmii]